jgi:hypothetical protein
LAKCRIMFFLQIFLYDFTVKMASIWLYCETVKSEYIFFSPVHPNVFFKIQNQNIFLGQKHIKLKLNSWRGKLMNNFVRPKWFTHKPTNKRNKTVVTRKSHEKIFPSKIRLFCISLNWICANYFIYNELYIFFNRAHFSRWMYNHLFLLCFY